jgi:hypothetical protein
MIDQLAVTRTRLVAIVGAGALLTAANTSAQTNGQVWANITFDWVKPSGVTYELDFEPKVMVSVPPGEPGWNNLDITSSVEYPVSRLLDLIGEVVAGRTKQTDDVDTTELTVRGGVRFHLFSRQRRLLLNETLPKRRLVIRDLVRVESRNFFYSNGDPSESTIRVRNRLELMWPLNRPNLGDDGAVSALSDWEWFIPVSDPTERFANRQRIRAGLTYRHSVSWRFAALYIWNRSRDTTTEPFTTAEHIFDVQVKRVW